MKTDSKSKSEKRVGEALPLQFVDLLEIDWEAGKEVKVTCPECFGSFLHNEYLAQVFPNTHCDDCCETLWEKKVQEELTHKLPGQIEETIKATIPPLYTDTDPERLPYKARQDVLSWEGKRGGPGLWMLGDTRTGKTRTLCLLLTQLMEQGKEVMAFFHGAFADDLLDVLRSSRSFKAWKAKVTNAPILALDDLFAQKLTERAEATAFEILDHRIAWNRPTIITTQVTATEANSRFQCPKRCEAFFARVEEFFTLIPFRKEKQEEMKI